MTSETSEQASRSDDGQGERTFKKILNPVMWSAIFTGVLTVFSFLLWRVSDKANDTSVATQRAFISFSGPAFGKDIKGGKLKGVNVYCAMSNSGTMPASQTVLEWNKSLGSIVPQKGLDFDTLPQNERMQSVLGPKASFQFKPVYLSSEDLEAVTDGKEHLFFWGWVTYRDTFKSTPKRLSEFCIDIAGAAWTKPNHQDPTADFNFITPPCNVHYCYDEDCEDYATRTK